MKVYEIRSDVRNFQWLFPDVPDSQILDYTTFDGTSRIHSWQSPGVFCLKPLLQKGDFLHFGSGNLLANQRAMGIVGTFFEMSGELLPLWYDNEQYTLLNVLECINCLDVEKSDWLRAADGSFVEIRKYRFHVDRFTTSPIFKIPETRSASVLTWERDGCPESEFKACVESHGLSGLIFKELWDSEQE